MKSNKIAAQRNVAKVSGSRECGSVNEILGGQGSNTGGGNLGGFGGNTGDGGGIGGFNSGGGRPPFNQGGGGGQSGSGTGTPVGPVNSKKSIQFIFFQYS